MSRALDKQARERLDALVNTTPGKDVLAILTEAAENNLNMLLGCKAEDFLQHRGGLNSILFSLKQISGKTPKIRIVLEN
jgi:hypothetical protein